MKKITEREKKEIDNLYNMLQKLDNPTKIFLMGYAQGLGEKKSVAKILTEPAKK